MTVRTKTQLALRPFWGRLTVEESPVDEDATESGLLLPMKHDDDDGILRGIVLHCSDRNHLGYTGDAADHLPPGTVVYYSAMAALKVAGITILNHADVLAWEEA